MSRNPFARRRSAPESDPGDQEYWLSYSDLMAGLLMVFVLMLLVAVDRYNRSAEHLQMIAHRVEGAITTMAVRDSIIEAFRRVESLSGASVISIDSVTAAVRLSDAILFDENSAELKPEGRDVLSAFARLYLPVVMENRTHRAHLREIAVEGHTNDNGPYLYNVRLSQERAYAVMNFFLRTQTHPDVLEFLQRYMTAKGRSYSRVICTDGRTAYARDCGPDAAVDKDASRRIEIQFRLDDEEVVREVKSLLESS